MGQNAEAESLQQAARSKTVDPTLFVRSSRWIRIRVPGADEYQSMSRDHHFGSNFVVDTTTLASNLNLRAVLP